MKIIYFIPLFILLFSHMVFAQTGGTALFFDGSNDYVDCGADTSLDLKTEFTLQAWIRGDYSNNSWARILDKFNFHARQGYNIVRYPDRDSFMIDFFSTENTKHTVVGSTNVFDNRWHFISAVYDGDTTWIYIDGKIEAKEAVEQKTIQPCSFTFKIGNGFDGNMWFPYRGYIDEVRVWSASLDSNTVRNWIHRNITSDHPSYDQLVGYWKFDEGSGSMTGDLSSSGNHGDLVNMDTLAVWHDSFLPLATEVTDDLNDLTAIWAGKDSAHSSVFSLKGTDIKNHAFIIFGHDGQDLSWIDTDVPGESGTQSRLKRIWRVEVFDTISADIIFNICDPGWDESGLFVLLVSSSPAFANADTVNAEYDEESNCIVVSGPEIKTGDYYTLGSQNNLVRIEDKSIYSTPQTYMLHQNFPNPFNPITVISYQLSAVSKVELSVYNLIGQKVATLFSGRQKAGSYQVKWDGSGFSSGIYYYMITAGNYSQVEKMILIK